MSAPPHAIAAHAATDWATAQVERLVGARFGTMLDAGVPAALPAALLAVAVVLAHVAVLGWCAWRALRLRAGGNAPAAVGAAAALGIAALGGWVWLLGHLRVLRPMVLLGSAGACLTVAALAPRFRADLAAVAGRARAAARRHPVFAATAAALLAAAAVSGLRPPVVAFDDDYHWQTATHWASAGGWARSPYRLTNGPAMAEMLYAVGAAFGSPTAAHWTATMATAALAAAAAGIARRAGVPGGPAAAAVVSVPVVGTHASLLLNDAMTTALTLGSFAVCWCVPDDPEGGGRPAPPRKWLAAGLLLAGAASCKFLALAALPAGLWLAVLAARRAGSVGWRVRAMCNVATYMVPVVLVAGLWTAHTYALTGQLRDGTGQYMARSPDDAYWRTGAAAGRIPSAADVVRLPLDLLQTTLWGQKEPYGGRTGLLWLALLPAGFWACLWRAAPAGGLLPNGGQTPPDGRLPLQMLLIALATFFLLGPIALKTRFHMSSFVLLTLFGTVGWHRLRRSPRRWAALVVDVAFLGLVWVGTLDGIRKLMMGIIIDPPPG